MVMIVPPDFPAKTLQEFMAMAKQQPGKLNFSSAGVASTSFLSGEILRQNANVQMVHVPYKGAPEAITAVIRGDAQFYFAPIPSAEELRKDKKVNILAINSSKRMPQLPDTPTVAESGFPNYRYDSWFGVMAPAGTPKPILDKVSQDIAKALQMSDVKEKLETMGSFPAPTTPEQFDEVIKSDTERYGKILRDAGIGTN
jgi:tripartite-type tricarboxylate transporter receptor subunit TctC